MPPSRRKPLPIRFGLLPRVLASAADEEAQFARDPQMRRALVAELRIGQQIAWYGRIVALTIIAALLPILNPNWEVLYYEAQLLVALFVGWQIRRYALIGRARHAILWTMLDVLVLVFVLIVPNPFLQQDYPTALLYRFDNFIYFFVLLALASLGSHWRLVWLMALVVATMWMAALGVIMLFGHTVPVFSEFAAQATAFDPDLRGFLDLNDPQPALRLQEIVVFLIVAGALTLKGWRTNQLLLRQGELAAERANLSRYFAPTMVEKLASGADAIGRPATQQIAVMFTDLVGFTLLAERLPDDVVLAFLRRYYSAIERVVFDHGGTLDKYLGDGVMATFGTPVPGPSDATNALRAARAIVIAVDALSRDPAATAMVGTVSVGVHFGPATVGDVGPARRLEFAVIGDTVNVASRLESATRELACRIVVSEALVAKASSEGATKDDLAGYAQHGQLELRGRSAAVDVWILGSVDARDG